MLKTKLHGESQLDDLPLPNALPTANGSRKKVANAGKAKSRCSKATQGSNKHPTPIQTIKLRKNVAAIHIGADLSLVERKLANVLLLNAYDKLLENRIHTIPVPILMVMLGWDESQNIQHLQEALKKLNSTPIQFNLLNDGKASWHTMSMISYGKLEGGICSYSYADFLAEQLYKPDIYATINIRVQRLFDSSFAFALYENCLRFKNIGSTGWWPVDTYRSLVGATANIYDEFKYLSRDAIKKPVNEVNKVSDIRLQVEFKKSGTRVTDIRFLIQEAPQSVTDGIVAPVNADGEDSGIRGSELFAKLRSHGIGERLAITWIRQDPLRARATVEYVEKKAIGGKVKGSTAGYIRTLFESEADIGKSDFESRQEEKAMAAKAAEAKSKKERESAASKKDKAKAAALALSKDERIAYARQYLSDPAVQSSVALSSWSEDKGTFTNAMERIQFTLWLQNHVIVI